MNSKMLSICIPTYNRCQILDETLNKLFSNPDFDKNKIEVIVSDNCSTDRTKEVVLNYPEVKYFRNQKNESFYNLTTVLKYATGKYIKLFNDTFWFKKNSLANMLKNIKQHENEKINLFFYPNFLNNNNTIKVLNTTDSLIRECSFNTTWTASIGFWKNDFEIIFDKNKYASKNLPQLEWMYRIVENGKPTLIFFEDLFEIVVPQKKGGYNVFNTFVNDYLSIIKNEKIKNITFEIEKYRLFRFFVFPWLISLFITDKKDYSFQTKGVYKILFKKYWYEPYFYPMLIFYWLKKIQNETKNKKNN
jgi:glycosyltransferase involved in cell wall biosynthesis